MFSCHFRARRVTGWVSEWELLVHKIPPKFSKISVDNIARRLNKFHMTVLVNSLPPQSRNGVDKMRGKEK